MGWRSSKAAEEVIVMMVTETEKITVVTTETGAIAVMETEMTMTVGMMEIETDMMKGIRVGMMARDSP
jgi:hypothetical protein